MIGFLTQNQGTKGEGRVSKNPDWDIPRHAYDTLFAAAAFRSPPALNVLPEAFALERYRCNYRFYLHVREEPIVDRDSFMA